MEIYELASFFVELKLRGKDYIGTCPICGQEGFSVTRIYQLYYCFSCENGGNAENLAELKQAKCKGC